MSNPAEYQLFQMTDTAENQPYLFQSYSTILETGGSVHVTRYAKVYEAPLLPDMNIIMARMALEKRAGNGISRRAVSTGDVIVLSRGKAADCYFIDQVGMILIPDFFHMGTSGSTPILTDSTEHYKIQGQKGTWAVADTIVIGQSMFFLMDNEQYGKDVPSLILDSRGNVVIEDCCNNFDEAVMRQLQAIVHPEPPQPAKPPDKKPTLEHYQRYYENGEYVRSASSEAREEVNYNMIDGMNNNRSPRGRLSVRKRLKEKLALIHGEAEIERDRVKQREGE